VLTKLDESPALAAKLSEEKGLEFNHKSFDRGRIGMTSDDKTMTIKIRLGSFTEKFEKEDDFDYSEDAE